MKTTSMRIPIGHYGVLLQDKPASEFDVVAEQVRRVGYAILDAGYSEDERTQLSEAFNRTRTNYVQLYGEARLRRVNEYYTIRALVAHGGDIFVRLATNQNLLAVLRKLIIGKFILNQQNGIINPPEESYNQRRWHRDLPYQHFISSSPLAVNALFCIDDFNLENGSTFILPASHKTVNYPSESFIGRNALQVEAKAGNFILLDCMLYHSGGFNHSKTERRAINHVYTIPYFKQQIKLPGLLKEVDLTSEQQELFGFNFEEPHSIEQYLTGRRQ